MDGRPHTIRAISWQIISACVEYKSEQRRNKTARENATQEIVRDLNFPELTVRRRKFENQKSYFSLVFNTSHSVVL